MQYNLDKFIKTNSPDFKSNRQKKVYWSKPKPTPIKPNQTSLQPKPLQKNNDITSIENKENEPISFQPSTNPPDQKPPQPINIKVNIDNKTYLQQQQNTQLNQNNPTNNKFDIKNGPILTPSDTPPTKPNTTPPPEQTPLKPAPPSEEKTEPTPPKPAPDESKITPQPDQSTDTSKQPYPKPPVNPPIVVDPPIDYLVESKYVKEFYEIDEGIWKLKYYDEEVIIKNSTGLQYCYYVLSRPDRLISLTEIFCGVNDKDPNYIAPLIEGAVIDKNANKTVVENILNDYNEKILILERAKLIILQEEDALNGIFHDGDVDLDATVPTSKFDKEKEEKRIKKAKKLSLKYLSSMDLLERELEAYEDIVKKLNEQLKYQPKEVSNERNKYASRIRMGFSNFYKLLKTKKLLRLHDYLDTSIDVYSGYIYHPNDDFTTWKLTK